MNLYQMLLTKRKMRGEGEAFYKALEGRTF